VFFVEPVWIHLSCHNLGDCFCLHSNYTCLGKVPRAFPVILQSMVRYINISMVQLYTVVPLCIDYLLFNIILIVIF
jgi:hypothetical protein